ncbi:MAG: DsrE/DsrF/DrsH-like family protein [Candidatus Latescibacterota bacterium]
MNEPGKRMTLIVFSNDMDKAMAAFILATGAASSGMQVTMFFTFWGLSLLRKKDPVPQTRTLVEKMFGWMLPKGADDTTLSKMNFCGAGTRMMKDVMRKKNMPQVGDLLNMALSLEVKIVACTTSMEMMGIKKDDLIDGLEIGGVTTYLGEARDSGINLFI